MTNESKKDLFKINKKENCEASLGNNLLALQSKGGVAKAIGSGSAVLSYNFNKNTSIGTYGANNVLSELPKLLSPKGPRLGGNKKKDWYLPENLNKLLGAFFKSIYCLISKPKYINTPDKLIIEILYYISIPDQNIFNWYNFIYNNKN